MDFHVDTRILPGTEISLASEILRQGDPVVFPTETVYGLGAPLFHPEAIKKIFLIKGRPVDNPLIVHIASVDDVNILSDEIPPAFERVVQRFWPGPLAIVLKRREEVSQIVCAGHPTVAIRMPSHPVALTLIRAIGQPLAAPSANRSGRPSPTSAMDAFEDLQGRVKLILDGGSCSIGIESTVISLVHDTPMLLRPGQISREELEDVLNQHVKTPPPEGPLLSPGMKYRHYAPNARVRLVFRREKLQGPYILSPQPQSGERLLTRKTLYAELREADRQGVPEVEIDCSPAVQSDAALMNRLLKAAGCNEPSD